MEISADGTDSYKALSLGSATSDVGPVDIFVKASDAESTAAAIRDMGGQANVVTGDIITATVSADMIDGIAAMDQVEFIEAAKPIQMTNDVAALEINSGEVHQGINLPAGYTGKGVIVGIIDTGIDYTHPDFKDENGNSRIISIWDQTRAQGPAPTEVEDSYGTECNSESIAEGSCPLTDYSGHGTHVAGTAAGRHEVYGGVAPDANIIAVTYDSSMVFESGYADTIFSTKICQAAYYIFRKAEWMGMPAVVNMSLGTHIGPHDGTSLFEQCLSGLLKDSAGRAIVAAAGNEYSVEEQFTGIHAGYDVSGTMASNFVIRYMSKDNIYYIDFWGKPGSTLSIGLALHDNSPMNVPLKYSGLVESGKTSNGTFLDGAIEYSINYSETQSALNGKPHAGIKMKVSPSLANSISNYSFDLVVSGAGSFDAWLFPDKPAKTVQFTSATGQTRNGWTLVAGDRLKSIAIPATAPDIIAVAAYTTRNMWSKAPGCCQIAFSLGALLDFSSSGPSASPELTGMKPDIAAPGAMIASTRASLARFDELLIMQDTAHVLQSGTSMAASFVSGTIALMFSADSNFTYLDAKRYLAQAAYVDDKVGQAPNDRWGHGKLDVLATLETAINGGSSGHFDGNSNLGTPVEEEKSQGATRSGCSLNGMAGGTDSLSMFILLSMILAPLAALTRARRWRPWRK